MGQVEGSCWVKLLPYKKLFDRALNCTFHIKRIRVTKHRFDYCKALLHKFRAIDNMAFQCKYEPYLQNYQALVRFRNLQVLTEQMVKVFSIKQQAKRAENVIAHYLMWVRTYTPYFGFIKFSLTSKSLSLNFTRILSRTKGLIHTQSLYKLFII